MNKSDIDSIAKLYKSLWVNCKASEGTYAEIYNCFKNHKLEDVERALRDCAYEKSFEPSFAEIRAKIPGAKVKTNNFSRYVTATDGEKEEYEQQMIARNFQKVYIHIDGLSSEYRGYLWERM